ncbi:MAG: hypothetical protein NVSMB24_12740 [Mucilaginibacter sp.]
MKIIQRQDWDSKLFGYEVGKVDFDCGYDHDQFIKEALQFRLVYIYSKNHIQQKQFKLVDEKVLFSQSLNNNITEWPPKISLKSFKPDVDSSFELKELALQSGVFSRFYIDKHFNNNEYNKLYSVWIERSILREIAFDIVIAKESNILGFVTLNGVSRELASIGLLSVLIEARGRGIGKALVNEAILRARLKGFSKIQVATQKSNIPAMALYGSLNFELKECINIYHYWNI